MPSCLRLGTVRQLGRVLMSTSIVGSRSLPAHEIRKYRQAHGTQHHAVAGLSSNRVRNRNPRLACRGVRGRVQDHCGPAVRMTQRVYTELVQHAGRQTLFPQISILGIRDGNYTVPSPQHIVSLRRRRPPSPGIEARVVAKHIPQPVLRHDGRALEPFAKDAGSTSSCRLSRRHGRVSVATGSRARREKRIRPRGLATDRRRVLYARWIPRVSNREVSDVNLETIRS